MKLLPKFCVDINLIGIHIISIYLMAYLIATIFLFEIINHRSNYIKFQILFRKMFMELESLKSL